MGAAERVRVAGKRKRRLQAAVDAQSRQFVGNQLPAPHPAAAHAREARARHLLDEAPNICRALSSFGRVRIILCM